MDSDPTAPMMSSNKLITTAVPWTRCYRWSVLLNWPLFLFLVGACAFAGMQFAAEVKGLEYVSNQTEKIIQMEDLLAKTVMHLDSHVKRFVKAVASVEEQEATQSLDPGTKSVVQACKTIDCAVPCFSGKVKNFMTYVKEASDMISPFLSKMPGTIGLFGNLANMLMPLADLGHGTPSMIGSAKNCANRLLGLVRGGSSRAQVQHLTQGQTNQPGRTKRGLQYQALEAEMFLDKLQDAGQNYTIPYGMERNMWTSLMALEAVFAGELSPQTWQYLITTGQASALMET